MSNSSLLADYLIQGAGTPVGGAHDPPAVANTISAFYWDKTNQLLYVYDWGATTWKKAGGSSFNPFAAATPVKPTAASFTLHQNASLGGTATVTDLASGRGVVLTVPDNTHSGHNTALIGQAGLSSSTNTVKAMLHRNWAHADGVGGFGIYIKDSANSSVTFWYYEGGAGQPQLALSTINSSLAFTGNTWTTNMGYNEFPHAPFWMKMQITGGNLISSVSKDGEDYSQIDSRTIASLSASFNGTLSEVGIMCDMADGGGSSPGNQATHYLNCYEFDNTNP